MELAIIGAGKWGQALYHAYSQRNKVVITSRRPKDIDNFVSLDKALGYEYLIMALPAQVVRNWMSENLDVVILEGIFALYDDEMNKMFDKKIFVDLGYQEFIDRKSMDNRWGYEPDWYIQHIWDSYQEYREDILKMDDIIIIEENNADACLDDIFS